jgi:hypothetical protein
LSGRDEVFIHPKLMTLLTSDEHAFSAYES